MYEVYHSRSTFCVLKIFRFALINTGAETKMSRHRQREMFVFNLWTKRETLKNSFWNSRLYYCAYFVNADWQLPDWWIGERCWYNANFAYACWLFSEKIWRYRAWTIIIIIIIRYGYLMSQVFSSGYFSWTSGDPHRSGFKHHTAILSVLCVMFQVYYYCSAIEF